MSRLWEWTVTRKIARIYGMAVLVLIFCAASASAITFRLGGPSPGSAGVDFDNTSALYASTRDGRLVLIAQVGAPSPDGSTFSDIGVPSISPEGMVVFGAEELGFDGNPYWRIFRADPGAPAGRRLSRAFDGAASGDGCRPLLKTDPYAVAGSDGSIVFLAPEAGGHDAVFRYQVGHLQCVARVGDRTSQGHAIELLGFGSAQVARDGTLAFMARITDGAQPDGKPRPRAALLAARPGSGLSEVAVEGHRAPGGGSFGAPFGQPAIATSPRGSIIAFIDRTSTGTVLFMNSASRTSRAIRTGAQTELGEMTYISEGRPGLTADGTVVLRAACRSVTAIFMVKDGDPVMVTRQGSPTAFGTRLMSFGDPSVTSAGRVYLAGRDETERERMFIFDGPRTSKAFEVMERTLRGNGTTPRLFPGSLVVNAHGDFAFLGARPESDGPTAGNFGIGRE